MCHSYSDLNFGVTFLEHSVDAVSICHSSRRNTGWCITVGHVTHGHVIRMDDTLTSKLVFYGQLHHGSRCPGGQYKRYKDCLKSTLSRCGIAPSELEALAADRTDWHSSCKSAVEKFEIQHIQELESKRDLCKSGPPPTSNFECQICNWMCRSWIGLLTHKSRSWWWDPSRRRLSPRGLVTTTVLLT